MTFFFSISTWHPRPEMLSPLGDDYGRSGIGCIDPPSRLYNLPNQLDEDDDDDDDDDDDEEEDDDDDEELEELLESDLPPLPFLPFL